MRTYCIAKGTLIHCGDLNRKKVQKGGDICICMADSLCYTIETNTTLKSNYTSIKSVLKIKK